jgi:hypothetical protein
MYTKLSLSIPGERKTKKEKKNTEKWVRKSVEM